MFADEPAHGLWAEQATPTQPGVRKKFVGHLAQFVGEPVVDWRRKARFWLALYLARKDISHRFAKDVLSDRTEKSLQLGSRGYVPGHELGQLTIQKRHANLNRRCHAHFVVVSEIEARHENLRVEVQHLIQEVGVPNALECRTMHQARIKPTEFGS